MKKFLSILASLALLLMLLPAAALAGIDSLTLSSHRAGEAPEYRIQYTVTGKDLYQAAGDYISVIFDSSAGLPAEISPRDILVNSLEARQVRVSRSQGRVDILVPSDISVNQTVDILFRSGAGIKNPPAPGRYAIGVATPGSPVVSRYLYSITAGSVGTPAVEVIPASPDLVAGYTISFDVSEEGGLLGGSDTISVTFPQEINLPASIGRESVTVNGRPLDGGLVTLSGKKMTVTVPSGAGVEGGGAVAVRIKPEAGVKNPEKPGTYRLYVNTSRDTVPVLSEPYTINGSAVSDLRVEVTPSSAGAAAQYDIYFKTSPYGTLQGGRDSITISFPAGTGVPHYISNSSIEVQGEPLDTGSITTGARTIDFVLPTGVYAGTGRWVQVRITGSAGITNPANPGTFNLSLSTSSDPGPTRSGGYSIDRKKAIILVIDSRTAFIDGGPVSLDVPAAIRSGRTMVPVRFVSEALGARVTWDDVTRQVVVYLDGQTIRLTIDSDTAYVNGRSEELDSPAVIEDGRTLVPIRFLAENFGSEVGWDGQTRTVTISK